MRLPLATLLLSLVIIGVYFWSSEGALYPADAALGTAAFGLPNLGGVLFHLFFHIGLLHLFGNLLPLVLFAFVVEEALSSKDVFLVFLSSGLLAGVLFSLFNPSIVLVGASAGVSGLMAAGAVASPKKGIVFLVLLPVFVSLVLVPAVNAFSQQAVNSMVGEKQGLEDKADALAKENKPAEAEALKAQAVLIQEKIALTIQGQERERNTPTDLMVHAVGAAIGFSFVALLRKEKFEEGMDELGELYDGFFSKKKKAKAIK